MGELENALHDGAVRFAAENVFHNRKRSLPVSVFPEHERIDFENLGLVCESRETGGDAAFDTDQDLRTFLRIFDVGGGGDVRFRQSLFRNGAAHIVVRNREVFFERFAEMAVGSSKTNPPEHRLK